MNDITREDWRQKKWTWKAKWAPPRIAIDVSLPSFLRVWRGPPFIPRMGCE